MRNPLRSEAEAFRFLIAVIVGALVLLMWFAMMSTSAFLSGDRPTLKTVTPAVGA